jgi:hypothetical protein
MDYPVRGQPWGQNIIRRAYLKLELFICKRLPCPGINKGDQIIFVPDGDVVTIR